ncbi:hypothetical protein TSUD_290660 [Trifolium subterraneum]|uniref:RNase H type-1 domain-containing protein n=1 Tax=Trifolium subterraneum TaxID=3900 RepID=A0A2Z6PGZ6_TRISU|nr:hypothetical protein TSUD_290660 [Trifolium subterraneum]
MLVFWPRPSEDQVALNVDGSSYGNHGPAGYGGLIRNRQGLWISGFSGHINHADSLEAELLAIMHGLMLVWDYGYPNVSCISDCKNALRLIDLEPIFQPPKYIAIINAIQELISRDWNVSFVHTYREANQCADFMAKLGTKSMNNCFEIFTDIFLEPPTDLTSLLESDAEGTGYSRTNWTKARFCLGSCF